MGDRLHDRVITRCVWPKNGWVRPLGSPVFGSRSPYMYIHVYSWPKHYNFWKVAILIQEMVFQLIKLFQVEHWWLSLTIKEHLRSEDITKIIQSQKVWSNQKRKMKFATLMMTQSVLAGLIEGTRFSLELTETQWLNST